MPTLTWETDETDTLFDATHPRYLAEYVLGRGSGKLSSNVGEAAIHTRIATDGPAPDFQFLFGAAYYFDNGFRTYPGSAFTLGAVLRGAAQRGRGAAALGRPVRRRPRSA